jgi:hypothetical protein
MTEAHVTNDAGTPETVTMVTRPKRDRAEYMREYRARQNKSDNPPELNSETPNIPPQPEINAAPVPKQKTTERYEQETAPKVDEAGEALRRQYEELQKSEQINRQYQEQQTRRQQEQQAYVQQINQVFNFWKQSGLSPDQEQILRANTVLMIQLTDSAAQQATRQGHQFGTAEHIEAAKKAFFEQLEQARQHATAPQSTEPLPTAGNQTDPAMETPPFFKPPPAKPPRTPASHYSAPVSREVPSGNPRPGYETDERRVTLSPDEKVIAKNSGISEVEYARNKIKMLRMKASGEIQG